MSITEGLGDGVQTAEPDVTAMHPWLRREGAQPGSAVPRPPRPPGREGAAPGSLPHPAEGLWGGERSPGCCQEQEDLGQPADLQRQGRQLLEGRMD